MPYYIAVCCFQCKQFQGQQENKRKNFRCKVCGEIQSVRHIFARSDYPKYIRIIVQELNKKRAEMKEKQDQEVAMTGDTDEYIQPREDPPVPKPSLWASFVDDKTDEQSEEEPGYIKDSSLLYPKTDRSRRKPREEGKKMTSHKRQAEMQPLQRQPNRDEIQNDNNEEMNPEKPTFITDLEKVDEFKNADEEMINPISFASNSKESMWSTFM